MTTVLVKGIIDFARVSKSLLKKVSEPLRINGVVISVPEPELPDPVATLPEEGRRALGASQCPGLRDDGVSKEKGGDGEASAERRDLEVGPLGIEELESTHECPRAGRDIRIREPSTIYKHGIVRPQKIDHPLGVSSCVRRVERPDRCLHLRDHFRRFKGLSWRFA